MSSSAPHGFQLSNKFFSIKVSLTQDFQLQVFFSQISFPRGQEARIPGVNEKNFET
jgi:hypothetical protein